MSMLQLQTAMARLLASPAFREQVRKDGGESLNAYQLSELERQELLALLEGRMGLYADCVVQGKEDFLLANLPVLVTTRLSPELLRPALRRFMDQHPGATLHPRDAGLAFVLRWMEEDLPRWPAGTPAHARDVLHLERLRRQVMAAHPRYAQPPGTPVPDRLVRHTGWDAERFWYDVRAGVAGEVWWVFTSEQGVAKEVPCLPVLVELARAFDFPAPVAEVVAAVAARHQGDPGLGPDVAGAVRQEVGQLFAEGSLRPG